ncbi:MULTISPECIES: hypothetical protein [unclassified Streptomyces]|uniref:hypothetical protein n=1 Tax=unclassified Streptomyces TaxID=2593676 RepID=UPI00115FBD64|nr:MULTISPECIES: hypothetical protein [unclassified Streptomyces]
MTTMDLTAFCLFFPKMNFYRPSAGGRAADSDLGAVFDPGLPVRTEMVDDFGECPEADVGQYVVGGTVAEVDERCQQMVDEAEFVFHTGTHGPVAGTRREHGLVPLVP